MLILCGLHILEEVAFHTGGIPIRIQSSLHAAGRIIGLVYMHIERLRRALMALVRLLTRQAAREAMDDAQQKTQ